MKKNIFYLSTACVLLFAQACSTSEFASHIHRSDMVRAEKIKSNSHAPQANLEYIINKTENRIKATENNSLQADLVASTTTAVPSLNIQKEERLQTASEIVSSTPALEQKFSSKKELRKEIRKVKQEYRSKSLAMDSMQLLIIIFAILIPPIGVLLYDGGIETPFWISLILTLLGWLPGAVYSILHVTGTI